MIGLTALATGLTAAPALAGGILPIASPTFGTSCANHGAAGASAATAHSTGTADGNSAGLPVSGPFHQCGGADFPNLSAAERTLLSASDPLLDTLSVQILPPS